MKTNDILRKTFIFITFVLFMCAIITGCDKSEEDDESKLPNDGSTVYILGYIKNYQSEKYNYAYWVNSQRYDIPKEHFSQRVIDLGVSNGDVYITGYVTETSGGNYIGCYWKNDAINYLSVPDNAIRSYAGSIYISDGDIYIVGSYNVSDTEKYFCYWKNGIRTNIQSNNLHNADIARDIAVTGEDVYISGDYQLGSAVWKNGEILYTNDRAGSFKSLFIDGPDVYALSSINGYYKNGEFIALFTPKTREILTYLHSFFVYEGDVYIVGENAYVQVVWKNTEATEYAYPTEYGTYLLDGYFGSIYIHNGNIYITGSYVVDNDTYNHIDIGCYWINNMRFDLSSGATASAAYKIVVQ